MDANSGEPWSEMDISDLTNELAHGRTMAETASFLCRDEDEVRQKAKELGLLRKSRPIASRTLLWAINRVLTTPIYIYGCRTPVRCDTLSDETPGPLAARGSSFF